MEITPDLHNAVHQVLARWFRGGYDTLPWNRMLTVAAQRERSASDDLAVKQMILDALETMEKQESRALLGRILRLRFLDDRTVRETAARLNLTTDMVHKRQRKGIAALAAIIWQAEERLRRERAERIAKRFEITNPPRLFGVEDKRRELITWLTGDSPPWLIAVVGLGGIGKTSLADAAAREIALTPAFADIAWVSARRERFTLYGGLEKAPPTRPALTFEGLLEAIGEQFGFQDLTRLTAKQKRERVQARFRERPYLVVVDNLETAADYQALIPELRRLVDPSRFLLTSRHRLYHYSDVHNLNLDELSAADSLALIRHEAEVRQLSDVARAPDEDLAALYGVAGGNPLALKLLVGQLHALSLPQVVDGLRQAQGKKVQDLYRHIYRRSWELLDEDARRALTVMPLLAEIGGDLDHLLALSALPPARLNVALEQLVDLSLVNVRGDFRQRRYGIHRLTETFLLNEVFQWPDNP